MVFYGLGQSGTWIWGWRKDNMQMPWEEAFSGSFCQEQPFEFEVIYPGGGERLPDLLGTGPFLHAASPRMLQVLQSIGATGYQTHPVILRHTMLGVTIHGYQGLLVHGRGGRLDEKRSKPHRDSMGGALLACDGYYIYEDQWDGSDLFRIEGLGFSIWVTERVAQALGKVRPKLRNVYLRPNTQEFPSGRNHL